MHRVEIPIDSTSGNRYLEQTIHRIQHIIDIHENMITIRGLACITYQYCTNVMMGLVGTSYEESLSNR